MDRITNNLAESVRDFLHVVSEYSHTGTPMEDAFTYGMYNRARKNLAAFEDSPAEKGGGDDG